MEAADVANLVQQQLALLTPEAKSAIEPGLVDPTCIDRAWDYPGPNYAAQYPCWTVWQGPHSVDIAYCEGGFGPHTPWGLVWRDPSASIGPDYAWYPTLAVAFTEVIAT